MKWARAALTQAVDNKEIKQVLDPNISQQEDDLQDWPFEPQTSVGFTHATRPHLRRQKVMYYTEATVNEGEVGDEKVTHVKTLPPELAPKPDEPGKTRGKGFSAFFEKNKKVKKENLDTLLDYDSWLKQQTERK